MKLLTTVAMLMAAPIWASAQTEGEFISKTIVAEYNKMRDYVERTKPDGMVGGYLYAKNFGEYKLLWRLAESDGRAEVIRIYRAGENYGQGFSVTYHKNRMIVPGRVVVRRFYGPDAAGWRNDTVDWATGQYLGRQGARKPGIVASDREIMQKWGLTEF